MKVSYAIPVCNEGELFASLLKFLSYTEEDEIVILVDWPKLDEETAKILEDLKIEDPEEQTFKIRYSSLDGNFAKFKNELNSYCTGDYIFQIDADEIPGIGLVGENLHKFLDSNSTIDLFIVPRINLLNGAPKEEIEEYVKQQGWFVNKRGWINWPDNQARLYRNSENIKWEGKVHETIKGAKTYAVIVSEFGEQMAKDFYHLEHNKSFKRQVKQNEFYANI